MKAMQNTGSNFEIDNTTGRNHEGRNANTPVRVLTATSIIGDDVENSKGDKLGTIKDIMLDIRNGSIEYVVLKSGGFLGIGDKLFAIPFQALQLNAEEKIFILNKDESYIKNAPGFDQDHWPETNSQYNEINTYWGYENSSRVGAIDTPYSTTRTTSTGTTGVIDPVDPDSFVTNNRL
jgi:sporulation protein YlmC with PRC-barrel domain